MHKYATLSLINAHFVSLSYFFDNFEEALSKMKLSSLVTKGAEGTLRTMKFIH